MRHSEIARVSLLAVVTACLVAAFGCGGEADGPSAAEEAFAQSVERASAAQETLYEIEPTPPIFDYTPLAERTLYYLVDARDLTRVSERGLIAVYAETTQARRTLRSTAEFQDLEQAREEFEAAIDPIDKTFRSANGVEQAFIEDWAALLETGVKEASWGNRSPPICSPCAN